MGYSVNCMIEVNKSKIGVEILQQKNRIINI